MPEQTRILLFSASLYHAYLTNHTPKLHTKFPESGAHGCGSAGIVGRNTLCMSEFEDDVIFSYNEPSGDVSVPQQLHCSVVHGL